MFGGQYARIFFDLSSIFLSPVEARKMRAMSPLHKITSNSCLCSLAKSRRCFSKNMSKGSDLGANAAFCAKRVRAKCRIPSCPKPLFQSEASEYKNFFKSTEQGVSCVLVSASERTLYTVFMSPPRFTKTLTINPPFYQQPSFVC